MEGAAGSPASSLGTMGRRKGRERRTQAELWVGSITVRVSSQQCLEELGQLM